MRYTNPRLLYYFTLHRYLTCARKLTSILNLCYRLLQAINNSLSARYTCADISRLLWPTVLLSFCSDALQCASCQHVVEAILFCPKAHVIASFQQRINIDRYSVTVAWSPVCMRISRIGQTARVRRPDYAE